MAVYQVNVETNEKSAAAKDEHNKLHNLNRHEFLEVIATYGGYMIDTCLSRDGYMTVTGDRAPLSAAARRIRGCYTTVTWLSHGGSTALHDCYMAVTRRFHGGSTAAHIGYR